MVKRFWKNGLLILFAFFLVVSGCAQSNVVDGIQTVDAATYQPTLPEPLDVGSVQFEVDATHTAALDYSVDNFEEQVLQVTDASGMTWTLSLPPGALDYDQTITMTALSNITSADIPGDLIGGVLLEPDGLILAFPATMTVSGVGEQAVLLFFTGEQDGTAAEIALPTLDQSMTSAAIFHFSAFWSDDVGNLKMSEDPNWLNYMNSLNQNLETVLAAVEKLLNAPITYPVPPPSIDLSGCKDDEGRKNDANKVDAYFEQFSQPETNLINQLMSIQIAQEKATSHWGYDPITGEWGFIGSEEDPRILEHVNYLVERLVKKLSKLMTDYGKKTEYLPVMGRIFYKLKYYVQLLGGDETIFMPLDSKLAALYKAAIDELIKKIVEQHDYSAMYQIIKLKRTADWLQFYTGEDIWTRIQMAMTFKMIGNYTWSDPDGSWELKTEFTVSFDISQDGRLTGSGPGTISYVNALDPAIIRNPGGFDVQASIKLDVCNSQAIVMVTPYAAESDTFTPPAKYHVQPITVAKSMAAWTVPFSEYEAKTKTGDPITGANFFTVTFWNLDAKPVNQNFDGKTIPNSSYVGIFSITLEHTPQK